MRYGSCVHLVVAIAFIVSSDPVSAEPGPAVYVRLDVQSGALDKQWGPAAPRVAADVQKALAARLKNGLPHWEYQPLDSGGSIQVPLLLFEIRETTAGALFFRVDLHTQTFVTPAVTAPWLASSDIMLTGYPSPSTAAGDIVSAISSKILDRHETDLRSWLSQFVPIAVGAHWMRDTPPRLVLSLPWSRYDTLRESVFRLICDWPSQGTAIVESIGPGLPAPYSPPPPNLAPNPPFDGVVVIAREREFAGERKRVDQIGRDELFELHPRLIFLKEYRPVVTGWNVVGAQP